MLVIDFHQFCKVAGCAHTQTSGGADDTGSLRGRAQPRALRVVGAKRRSHLYWAKSERKKRWSILTELVLCATQRLSGLSPSAFTASHALPMKTPRPRGLAICADSG